MVNVFKYINFCFVDKKLCRELTRLPILWLHPNDRKVDYIHGIISKTIGESNFPNFEKELKI